MEIKIEEIVAQPALAVKEVTSQSNIGNLLGKNYGMILQELGAKNQQPAGAPFIVYYNLDPEHLEVEMGFPVASPIEAKQPMELKTIPAGKAVTCIHKGSYKDLHVTYTEMTKWLQENALESAYVAYEYYLNSVSEVPEDELLTKVVMYLK